MQDNEGSSMDDVYAVYQKDIDVSLLRENLKLTVSERMDRFERFMRDLVELRGAAKTENKPLSEKSDH